MGSARVVWVLKGRIKGLSDVSDGVVDRVDSANLFNRVPSEAGHSIKNLVGF